MKRLCRNRSSIALDIILLGCCVLASYADNQEVPKEYSTATDPPTRSRVPVTAQDQPATSGEDSARALNPPGADQNFTPPDPHFDNSSPLPTPTGETANTTPLSEGEVEGPVYSENPLQKKADGHIGATAATLEESEGKVTSLATPTRLLPAATADALVTGYDATVKPGYAAAQGSPPASAHSSTTDPAAASGHPTGRGHMTSQPLPTVTSDRIAVSDGASGNLNLRNKPVVSPSPGLTTRSQMASGFQGDKPAPTTPTIDTVTTTPTTPTTDSVTLTSTSQTSDSVTVTPANLTSDSVTMTPATQTSDIVTRSLATLSDSVTKTPTTKVSDSVTKTPTTKVSDSVTRPPTTKASDSVTKTPTTKVSDSVTKTPTTKVSDSVTRPPTTKVSDSVTRPPTTKVSDSVTKTPTTKVSDSVTKTLTTQVSDSVTRTQWTPKVVTVGWVPVDPMTRFSPFEAKEVQGLSFSEQLLWFYDIACSPAVHRPSKRDPVCVFCNYDEECQLYGDCCPAVKFQTSFHEGEKGLTCSPLIDVSLPYFMVTSCPSDLDPSELKVKCENASLEWREQLPVTDPTSQTTYRNKYCAICNHVTSYVAWALTISCLDKAGSEAAVGETSAERLYHRAVEESICDVEILPPDGVVARPCTPVADPLVSTCNVTGLWPIYDERIVRACANFTAPMTGYGNPFCKVCNDDLPWFMWPKRGPLGYVSFTAVLNLQCRCRPLTCASGRTLTDGACVSIISRSVIFAYRVSYDATLTSALGWPALEDVMKSLAGMITGDFMKDFRVVHHSMQVISVTCGNHTVVTELSASLTLSPYVTVSVHATEQKLVSDFDNNVINFQVGEMGTSARVRFTPRPLASAGQKPDLDDACAGGVSLDEASGMYSFYTKLDFVEELDFQRKAVKDVTPLVTCVQVQLNPDEFSFSNETSSIVITASSKSLPFSRFSLHNSSAAICLQDYLAGLNQSCDTSVNSYVPVLSNTSDGRALNSSLWQSTLTTAGIMSLSCCIVSLFCLAITLVAYIVFKELRTTAGVCTMCMIVVLFLAQAVFEFGVVQTDIAGLCVALGVLSHYLWLSATFWMNVCTSLMFYNLVFPLQARVHLMSGRKILSMSFLYTCLCPGVIVSSTLAANHFLHGDLGYGGALCYVKRAATRRLAVALPIGCLVLLNLGLFGATLLRLRRGSGISCSRESRIGLWGCAKLSVITGLSWVFLFLYEAFPYPAVEYVAILLFGLYGLVVFVAFVLNRRVFGLIRSRLHKGSPVTSEGRSLS